MRIKQVKVLLFKSFVLVDELSTITSSRKSVRHMFAKCGDFMYSLAYLF